MVPERRAAGIGGRGEAFEGPDGLAAAGLGAGAQPVRTGAGLGPGAQPAETRGRPGPWLDLSPWGPERSGPWSSHPYGTRTHTVGL